MTNNRKSLDDSLAEAFVYGGEDQKGNLEVLQKQNSPRKNPRGKTPKSSDLISKLQEQPKERTVRFTADLPESIHKKLSILAAQTGKKKVEIVRMLLIEALAEIGE